MLFLTGKEEIDAACEILYERMKKAGKSREAMLWMIDWTIDWLD